MSEYLEPIWSKPVNEYPFHIHDPLGMNTICDKMIQELATGITTTQISRARYYIFYVWAIQQIRKMHIRNLQNFGDKFYDLERLFMLSCIAHEHDTTLQNRRHNSIIGSRIGNAMWQKYPDEIPLDFKYSGDRLGGYGKYYRQSLFNLGLIKQDIEDEYERPTQLGLDTIDSFDKIACKSEFLSYCDGSLTTTISKRTLFEIGQNMCLCNVRDQKYERQCLQRVFFDTFNDYRNDVHVDVDDSYPVRNKFSNMRRKSLALILYAINQTDVHDDYTVDGFDFLDSVYFGDVVVKKLDNTSNLIKVYPLPELQDASERWKVVKAHDNFSFAIGVLFQSFLGFCHVQSKEHAQLDDFFESVFDKFDYELENILVDVNHKHYTNTSNCSIQEILCLILAENHPSVFNDIIHASKQYDDTIASSLQIPHVNERLLLSHLERLSQIKYPNTSQTAANSVLLIILIAFRFFWRINEKYVCIKWGKKLEADNTGIIQLTDFIMHAIQQKTSIQDFTRKFIYKFVILQAQHVYRDKLRSDVNPKRWFDYRSDSGLLYFENHHNNTNKHSQYHAVHRFPRFDSAISILDDLGLVSISEKGYLQCTTEGQKMLGRVLRV